MTSIRAVTFDAGGTLIEPWPSVGAVYAEVAREFGLQCRPEKLNTGFLDAWRERSGFGYSRAEWLEVVRRTFAGLGEVSLEMFDAIYARFAEKRCWLIYDDVIPTLQTLENLELKLGVISNWDERLVPLLETLGLATYFEPIIVSATVGVHKPSREIFTAAAQALSLQESEILHIGDSQAEDVVGARNAGFHAFRIRRSGREQSHDLQSLTELERLLPGQRWDL